MKNIAFLQSCHQEVERIVRVYPHDMIHDNARNAIEEGDPYKGLKWILASYELSKPKIHGVTMTDETQVKEMVG